MLVRTRPFNPRASTARFDRAFDQLTSSFWHRPGARPVVDAAWDDGDLVLTVDLPGTPADAVDVAVAGRTLTLSATTDDHSWERSVRLGAALDPEQVTATLRRRSPDRHRRRRRRRRAPRASRSRPTPAAIERRVRRVADDQPENGTSDNA